MSNFDESLRITGQMTVDPDVQRITDFNDPYRICDFAEYSKTAINPTNMKAIEDAIIETGDLVHNLINELTDYIEYLKDYKGVLGHSIELLQNAQLEHLDNPLHLYEFAASVERSDKRRFEDAVINSGMPKYMYYMLEYVHGTDATRLTNAIKSTNNSKYIAKATGQDIPSEIQHENI